MGMHYKIIIGGTPERTTVDNIIKTVFSEINNTYNKWNPLSEISKINALPDNHKVPLSQGLQRFLDEINGYVKLSDGRFDPTIESVQKVWKNAFQQGKIPSTSDLQEASEASGWDNLHFDHGAIWKDHALTSIDLGGIAKGLAIDMLIDDINASGYPNVYVEWGGEIRATGKHPLNRPWRVYISHFEDASEDNAIAFIDLNNVAVATSGDYIQSWKIGETTYTHIINPTTDTPLTITEKSIASATVVADTCAFADFVATTLMLFESKEEATEWAANIPKIKIWLADRIDIDENRPPEDSEDN